MRRRSKRPIALASAIAVWYCAAALTQTSGGAQSTPRAAQPNPNPATMPSQPNVTPANRPVSTPASHATPTPTTPPPQMPRCSGLTGLPRAECERRDSTQELPAGVTQGQAERQAQRAAEETRDTQTRSSSTDTMRAPPASAPAPSTMTPAPTAPAPSSTPREDSDTLNRPRE